MPNAAGISGPFNPVIGIGTPQDGTANPLCILGVDPINIPSHVLINNWQRAALGSFIGVQSSVDPVMGTYHDGSTSVSVPKQPDFDSTFLAQIVTPASALGAAQYRQGVPAVPNQWAFF